MRVQTVTYELYVYNMCVNDALLGRSCSIFSARLLKPTSRHLSTSATPLWQIH